MQEVWKDVKGYEGLYQVSNFGNVKRLYKTKPCKVLKSTKDKDGYLRLCLSKNGKYKLFCIHRLVATAFVENPNNYTIVNHKDENPNNNNAENLEWCTVQYNTVYNNAHLKKGKLRKPILQLTLDGRIIREWNGRCEIEKTLGYSGGNITRCCLNAYGRKTAYGYKWKYKKAGE